MKVDKQKLDNVYAALDSLHGTLSEILDNPLPDHDGGNDDNLAYKYNSDTITEVYHYELHELRLIKYVLDFWRSRELHNLILAKRFHVLGVSFDEVLNSES